MGDWHREPQGGETGEVAVGVWDRLALELETQEGWVFWVAMGDWHREPQGGETGQVAVGVWEGLEVELAVEVWVFWLTMGD